MSVFGDGRISTHADPTSTRREIFHERRISSVTFTSAHLYGNVYMQVGVARALDESTRARDTQTVIDISTPCLSACVDNNNHRKASTRGSTGHFNSCYLFTVCTSRLLFSVTDFRNFIFTFESPDCIYTGMFHSVTLNFDL